MKNPLVFRCFVLYVFLPKRWIIGKTSSKFCGCSLRLINSVRFAHVLCKIHSSGSFAKLFHYCCKPSLSRLYSSFPFTVLIPRLLMISLFRQYMRLCPRNFVNPKLSTSQVFWQSGPGAVTAGNKGECLVPAVQSSVWCGDQRGNHSVNLLILLLNTTHCYIIGKESSLTPINRLHQISYFVGHFSLVHDLFSLSGRFQLILVEFQKIWNV